jgi:hypothetical protein
MPRSRLAPMVLVTLSACAPELAEVEGGDLDALASLTAVYTMAQLNVGTRERCANGVDDDRDGLIDRRDPDCGATSFGADFSETSNVHEDPRGTLVMGDGNLRYTYTAATSSAGGSLRLERDTWDARGRVVTLVTTVRLSSGDIEEVTPVLAFDRRSPTSTALLVGTAAGDLYAVDGGFGAGTWTDR